MSATRRPGRVSVVVASYNHARFLARRMDSLIAQTYENLEILVIDDRSTDNSIEILRRYESDPSVTLVIREANGGWVAVSNQGLSIATGEYVMFANCDDDCDPRLVERLVAGLVTHPTAGIAYCGSLLVDSDDKVLGNDFSLREPAFRARCATDTLVCREEMSRFLLHSCVIPNLSASLFRRDCLSVVGGFSPDYRVCSDWELFFRVVAQYDVFYTPRPMNRFRQHENTIRSATKERVVFGEYIRLLLGQIGAMNLTGAERARCRMRVMSKWAGSMISRSILGLKNGLHYARLTIGLDPLALLFLAPAIALRCVQVARIAVSGGGRDPEFDRSRR